MGPGNVFVLAPSGDDHTFSFESIFITADSKKRQWRCLSLPISTSPLELAVFASTFPLDLKQFRKPKNRSRCLYAPLGVEGTLNGSVILCLPQKGSCWSQQ